VCFLDRGGATLGADAFSLFANLITDASDEYCNERPVADAESSGTNLLTAASEKETFQSPNKHLYHYDDFDKNNRTFKI
jgi:hypothetical protein